MTTKEIAGLLVEMCRNGQVEEAKEKLFADNVVSIEPMEGLLPMEVSGMAAIREKRHSLYRWWKVFMAALFLTH